MTVSFVFVKPRAECICNPFFLCLFGNLLNFLFYFFSGTETGVNIEECIRAMPTQNAADIRSVVANLSEEGHIYSTISENHFKIAM